MTTNLSRSANEQGEFILGACVLEPEHPTHRCNAFGEDVVLEPRQLLDRGLDR